VASWWDLGLEVGSEVEQCNTAVLYRTTIYIPSFILPNKEERECINEMN
jgi:hypothetical protein